MLVDFRSALAIIFNVLVTKVLNKVMLRESIELHNLLGPR